MTLSAIVMMVISMCAIWGVAACAFVFTLRQEENRAMLCKNGGGCEPFSPRAFRDIVDALDDPDLSRIERDELQACHAEQIKALQAHERHLYAWSDEALALRER